MGMLWPTLETMLGLAVVLVLWLGGREVLLGRITLGKFVAFNTYMVQLTWPIIALGWVINIFQRGTASMLRIQEIFDQKPEVADATTLVGARSLPTADGDGHHPTPEIRGELEFRNLSFSYN